MWSWQYYIIYAPMPAKLAGGGGNSSMYEAQER